MKPRKEAASENLPAKKFPLRAEDYKLYNEVGQGVSASVHRALCIPLDEIVAIKVMDLERCGTDLDVIRREVQTMTLLDHANLLKAHCSFVAGTTLWIVTPFMDSGSCLHIMKYVHPTGFNQAIIATMLLAVLRALAYLHSEGLIHRDVKAGNVLVDSKGSVKLADFGVSASLFDGGDRRLARNTFVGTPCWMAPEVMQQLHGYDFKADIWSFGITALELAHGHAPFSNYPPMKVLLMTIQNAPPGLDYERDKKFSKSFKDLVSACLVKDPKRRPSAEKLLKHRFFRYAQSKEYVVQTILQGLPPLADRYRILKEKEDALLAQNKVKLDDKEQLSQKEYIRGISAWDFDPNDLKNQAALLGDDSDDDDIVPTTEDHVWIRRQKVVSNNSASQEKLLERSSNSDLGNSIKSMKSGNILNPDGSSSSLPNGSFKTLGGGLVRTLGTGSRISPPGENASNGVSSLSKAQSYGVSSLSKAQSFDKLESSPKKIPNGSGGESSRKFANGSGGESSWKSANSSSTTTASILPSLQYLLKQNSLQKEQIMKCLKYVQQANESATNSDHVQMFESFCREKVLESHLLSMTQYNELLLKDLEIIKMESAKLEKKIKTLNIKE